MNQFGSKSQASLVPELPAAFDGALLEVLRGLNCDLRTPSGLTAAAAAVQKLSDHYINHPDAATPYNQTWARVASLAWYLPLNWLRAIAVIRRGIQVGFFSDLSTWVDFGSGLGAGSLALTQELGDQFRAGTNIEQGQSAIAIHREILGKLPDRYQTPRMDFMNEPPSRQAFNHGTLTMFSYSMTEIARLPDWALQGEALMIIEPATSEDGRRLLQTRQDLISAGWSIWAPCTHAGKCPLLTESKRDWCHDRTEWIQPQWFTELDARLPMRNGTLTFSYLLARRRPAPKNVRGLARLTGDLQREKGASRQMVCRGEKREFLSWQKKLGEPADWPRGSLVSLDPGTPEKSKELRLSPDHPGCRILGSLGEPQD